MNDEVFHVKYTITYESIKKLWLNCEILVIEIYLYLSLICHHIPKPHDTSTIPRNSEFEIVSLYSTTLYIDPS